ncbi:MAG: YkvA family protein [Gammaproteobacteria bacterium]|nr:YkvA family protein [Gammaproteobacteria bacterium]
MSDEIGGMPTEIHRKGERGSSPTSRSGWLGAVAHRSGRECLRLALAFWYCLLDPDTPTRAKAIILAAVGYFILPVDAIPDVIPGVGHADDLGALALAVVAVLFHIKPEHRRRARERIGDD